jgi:hypothetical protein
LPEVLAIVIAASIMLPGFFDLAVLLYLLWGVQRGKRREFSGELPGFVAVVLFMATGSGLLHLAGTTLDALNHVMTRYLMGIGTIGVFLGAFWLVKHFKEQIRKRADSMVPETWQVNGGRFVGGLRCLLVAIVLLVFMAHSPVRGFVAGSYVGRPVTWFVPPM